MKRFATAALVVVCATACSDQPTALTDGSSPTSVSASAGTSITQSANPLDIAVIGDTPYGAEAIALFPTMVSAIDADPKVREVVHVGDLKSGSESCSDERFEVSEDLFNSFEDPMIYAIGDNEWSDCHRANNGGYNPLERLAKVREEFFPLPGQVLGGRGKTVEGQQNFPENQLWVESGVTFATLHILGSNNGLDEWFGDREIDGVPAPETVEGGEVGMRASGPPTTVSFIARTPRLSNAHQPW